MTVLNNDTLINTWLVTGQDFGTSTDVVWALNRVLHHLDHALASREGVTIYVNEHPCDNESCVTLIAHVFNGAEVAGLRPLMKPSSFFG